MQNRRWWDVAALAAASVIVLLTLIDPPYGPPERGAWAASAVFLVVYVAYARRHVGREEFAPHLVISIAFAVILAVGASFEPSFAILQAFIYPFVWSTAPTLRSALVANGLVAAAIVVGYVARSGLEGLLAGLGVAALSVGFSVALGLWITRIAEDGDERGRLLEELQAAQGQLAAMHRDAGVTDERARLAREIHDTIAQSLTGLVMLGQRARRELAAGEPREETLELIESAARDALVETRSLVAATAPVELDRGGVADALERLAERFRRETGVAVSVSVSVSIAASVSASGAAGSEEASPPALPRETEVVLLRAAQEGLANVRKHAGAGAASLFLVIDDAEAHLTVLDDGRGYDPSTAEPGFGIAGLRDRVALVGGEVAVDGTAGRTGLRVTLPRVAVTA